MKVSQVEFGHIQSGDMVLSAIGTFGRIVDKWIDPKGIGARDPDNYWIHINWANGNKTYSQHNDLQHVSYLEAV